MTKNSNDKHDTREDVKVAKEKTSKKNDLKQPVASKSEESAHMVTGVNNSSATSSPYPHHHPTSISNTGYHGADESTSVGVTALPSHSISTVKAVSTGHQPVKAKVK